MEDTFLSYVHYYQAWLIILKSPPWIKLEDLCFNSMDFSITLVAIAPPSPWPAKTIFVLPEVIAIWSRTSNASSTKVSIVISSSSNFSLRPWPFKSYAAIWKSYLSSFARTANEHADNVIEWMHRKIWPLVPARYNGIL